MADIKLIDEGIIGDKKPFEFLANCILSEFNFEKVHNAMLSVDWNWYFGEDEYGNRSYGIPNVSTLKHAAYKYLKEAYEKEDSCGSGGFMADWIDGSLSLKFVIEELSSF